MGCIGKGLVLVLILIMAVSCLSLMMVKPASAQAIPMPAVPQFKVRFVSASSTIEISIESQPFAYSNNGTVYQEYFNIRVKAHSAENWTEVYIYNGTSAFIKNRPVPPLTPDFSYAEYISPDAPIQSESGATANFYVTPGEFQSENNTFFEGYSIQYTWGIWGANPVGNHTLLYGIPIDGQLDFQVQALVGHNSTAWYNISALYAGVGLYVPAVAYDTAGNWSDTQTITITIGTTTSSPTPAVPEISAIMIVPLLLSVFSVAVILKHRNRPGWKHDV